jgi:DNA-binding NarL/FixJ family response regulator
MRRFIIADDHAMYRAGLRLLLQDSFGPATILDVPDLPALERELKADANFGLAIVDLGMPGMDGAATLTRLRREFPGVRFVVVSGSEDRQNVLDVLAAGGFGFIPKSLDPDAMVAAFRQVMEGGVYAPSLLAVGPQTQAGASASGGLTEDNLTPRQGDVLHLLGMGRSNKEIARSLDISEGTVKIHLAAIFRLLNVRNRTEAVLKAGQMKL